MRYERLLEKGERLGLCGVIFAVVAVVGWGIVVRYTPIPGAPNMAAPVEELSRLILVWLVFWGASWLQRKDSHYRLSILVDLLGGRTRLGFLIIGNLAVVGFLLLVIWQVPAVLENDADLASMVMLWPVNLWTYGYSVGIGLMLIYTVRRVVLNITELVGSCHH